MAAVEARPPPPSCTMRASRSTEARISSAELPTSSSVEAELLRIGDGRQPVLQLRVEAVLRLPRLQVEEAEHQRARKAEERGREGDAHARERRRQTRLQVLEDGAGVARADADSDWIVAPTELTVVTRPQNVPSRPRKTSRPAR